MIDTNSSWQRRRRRQRGRSIAVTAAVGTAVLSINFQFLMYTDAFQSRISMLSKLPSVRSEQALDRQMSHFSASRLSLEIPRMDSRTTSRQLLSWLEQPVTLFKGTGGSQQNFGGLSDSVASVRFGGRSNPHSGRRPNRVLGFAIQEEVSMKLDDEDVASGITTTSTCLSAHSTGHSSSTTSLDEPHDSQSVPPNSRTVSSVDSSVWNNFPKHLEEWYADTSPIKKQLASSAVRNGESLHMLPAWFPWLPTHTQICALKLEELKVACSERGLKKVSTHSQVSFPPKIDVLFCWLLVVTEWQQSRFTRAFVGLGTAATSAAG
jgi:hypothetical protein